MYIDCVFILSLVYAVIKYPTISPRIAYGAAYTRYNGLIPPTLCPTLPMPCSPVQAAIARVTACSILHKKIIKKIK